MEGPSYPDWKPAGGNFFYEISQSAREYAGAERITVFEVFAGEKSAWKAFQKYHNLRNMIASIPRFGCIENVSGNSGELSHKPLLKLAQQSNNRRQIAQGVTNHNARRGALLMMDAEEHRLAGRDDDDDSEKSDSDDLGPVDDAEKETYPCVVAAKYPLFEATFDLLALHMRIKATGKRGEGR
jgi:hypothetical protein